MCSMVRLAQNRFKIRIGLDVAGEPRATCNGLQKRQHALLHNPGARTPAAAPRQRGVWPPGREGKLEVSRVTSRATFHGLLNRSTPIAVARRGADAREALRLAFFAFVAGRQRSAGLHWTAVWNDEGLVATI